MSMSIARAKYTGDPGLGSWLKRAAGVATSFIPVVGGGISQAISQMGRRQPPIPTAGPGGVGLIDFSGDWAGIASRLGVSVSQAQKLRQQQAQRITIDPGAMWPGGAPGIQLGPVAPVGAGMGMAGPMNGAAMSGYHWNKSSYFLMSGEFVPEGSRMVKNRKRNPANARATSRSISRIIGAKKYTASLGRISIRKKC